MILPLDGVRVIECARVMAGPCCAMLLGDMGADVIKVESPAGDSTRQMAGSTGNESPSFWAVNRNKRGVVVNLKDERGRQIIRELVERSDILIEGFRPGVMASFGLDFESLQAINPALIYASISGFGQDGPYAQRGGFDLVAQGMSGIMSITGDTGLDPIKCGIPVTDLGAALLCVYGILAAYVHRLRTGEGQHVDASLLEAGIALSVWEATEYFSGRGVPQPMGSAHRMSAPYQAIRCSDGHITLGAANQRSWERFCHAIGSPQLAQRPEFATDAERVRNRRDLALAIESITIHKPRREWLEILNAADVPCGPILNYEEVFDDPHVRYRGMAQEIDHPVGGRIRQLRPGVKLSKTPPAIRRPAPTLGQHTEQVLSDLGYAPASIEQLAAEQVVKLGRTP